jgi:hypothetical protein
MTEYYNKTALFFPFHISYLDKKMLVDMNLTNDSTIKVGTEILSINGMDADTIMSELLKRMPRDGYNETYPLWILNEWFREYYSYVFGHPTVFRITIKTNDGVFEKQVNALSKDSILNTRKKLYPERLMLNENKKAITYKNMDSLKTGILKIYTFSGKMKKEYNQNFKKTIKSIFEEIKNNKTENLILDLRNNQGGGSAYGTYLFSYLLDKPFSYVRDYFAVRKVQNSSENRLKRKLYNRTRKTNPNKNIFSGNLFLLINGGSFSNSGIVRSCIETHKRAIIIGDEAAGNKTILTSMFTIKPYTILPNTKTVCDKPDYRTIIRDIKLNDGHGVLPNYRIIPTIKDIIYNKDAVLDFTFGLIREK